MGEEVGEWVGWPSQHDVTSDTRQGMVFEYLWDIQ